MEQSVDGGAVVDRRLPVAHAELTGVDALGSEDVVEHPVPIPPAGAWALVQLGRRACHHDVETSPAGLKLDEHRGGPGDAGSWCS